MNAQQQAFVRAYLTEANGNATKAAIIAGYSERTAPQSGSRLLKHHEVAKAVERFVRKADLSTEKALERVAGIAAATPEKVKASDVIKANELILRINGALKNEQSDTRVTVNIGFIAGQPAAISITEQHDASIDVSAQVIPEVMPIRAQFIDSANLPASLPGESESELLDIEAKGR